MISLNGNTKIEFGDKNIYVDMGTTSVRECHICVGNKEKINFNDNKKKEQEN